MNTIKVGEKLSGVNQAIVIFFLLCLIMWTIQ